MSVEGTANQPLLDEESEYKVYPKRFLVVTLFALAQMMTSIGMNTLNPIATLLSEIYDYSTFTINLGGLLYILMHPFFTFPAAYVIDSKGVRAGIIVGSVLSLAGMCLRLLVNQGFWLVIVGQVLAGIGRPFILNCQAKISANWFRAGKRGGVTSLLTLVVNVSLIIGILIPGVLFKNYQFNEEHIESGKNLAFKLMMMEAILAAICFLPNIIFQVEKPPTPPSESADTKRQPLGSAVKKLVRNKNYILLLFGFGLYFGLFNAISITLSQLLKPWFGNDSLAIAAVGGSPVISGIIGVMIIGHFQRKQRKFRKWIIICMLGSCFATAIFYPMLQTNSIYAACFVSALNSFFLIPLVPIMLELGCQLVFPVGEGTAVGLLFAFGNLFGFLLGSITTKVGSIMSFIVDGGKSKVNTIGGLAFSLGLFLIGLLLVFFMKQEKNREIHEHNSFIRRRSQANSLASSTISEDKDYIATENPIAINAENPEADTAP